MSILPRIPALATLLLAAALLAGGALAQQGPVDEVLPGREPGRPPLGEPRATGEVGIARLHYGGGGDWYSDPSSLPNLLREFALRTGIPAAARETVVKATDPALERTPFLYATGHGNLRLSPEEESRLRAWLRRGGFLWADDNYGLDASFRQAVTRLFPEERLRLVPPDHPIYHCFYDLAGVPKIHEHDGKPPQGWGLFLDGRLAIFYTYEADIGDGLEDPQVHGDPPEKREAALKMAINVLYYSLTRAR
ncbi:MAG: DUF4159 domain-containing protein [Candidatus Krumholzibacteriota bacterium]|nr:DUF4159 domain-containing protein [Candidatus Krumholzibacteriota bacterium]